MGWRWIIGLASAFGGGGIMWLFRNATREDMRQIFAAKADAVSPTQLHEHFERRDTERAAHEEEIMRRWETVLEKVEKRIVERMHTEVGSLGNKLTRDYEHLQRELAAFGKGVDQALRQSTDADRRSIETKGTTDTLSSRLDGIEKNIDIRLANITSMLDLLTRKNIA